MTVLPEIPLFRPLRAVRFGGVSDVSSRVCPPYDRISETLQVKLYQAHRDNAVRLTCPRQDPDDTQVQDRYQKAGQTLRAWLATGVVKPEPRPALYVYDVEFEAAPGVRRVRRACLGLMRLTDFSEGWVLPHEETLPGPRKDRLSLLRATGGAQFGPVFLMYFKKRRVERLLEQACERPPDAQAEPGTTDASMARPGELHRLWVVTDPAMLAAVKAELEGCKFVIADGHHRYATALEYRKERRREAAANGANDPDASYEFRLAALVDGDSDAVTIRSTHRVLKLQKPMDEETLRRLLQPEFELQEFPLSGDGGRPLLVAMASERSAGRRAYGIAAPGSDIAWLASKPRASEVDDVTNLHRLLDSLGLLPASAADAVETRLSFEKDPHVALAQAQAGEGIAFLVNPLEVEDVRLAAQAGRRLPQKSSDFHPKFLSGMVMYVPGSSPPR